MDYHTARSIAERVVAMLTPHCEKIKICGSIRRHKAEVNDIDIVCLPKIEPVKDIFGMVVYHKRVRGFVDAISSMEKIKGDPNGKYTQRKFEGMKVEIAMASPDNYGNLVLIRTGNADFSHMIMIMARKRGFEQREGFLYKGDLQISVPDEMIYFKTLGIPYVDPEKRDINAYEK